MDAQKRYRLRHPDQVRRTKRTWYRRKMTQDPLYFTRILRKRRKQNPKVFQQYNRAAGEKIRLEVFRHYCDGKPRCMCSGCRVTEPAFLTLQHIKGKGTKQRRRLQRQGVGRNFYFWVRQHDYPKYLTVFCANCNLASARINGCPHQNRKERKSK